MVLGNRTSQGWSPHAPIVTWLTVKIDESKKTVQEAGRLTGVACVARQSGKSD